MVVMLLPLRRQHRFIPESRSFLYLDDRTIVAPSMDVLQRACASVTCNHTNESKTQVWARTVPAFAALERDPKFRVEILGVSVGLDGRPSGPDQVKRQARCPFCPSSGCL